MLVKSLFVRRIVSLLLLATALPACQRPEATPAPADLLPRDKMVHLLIEMHLLEARVEATRLPPDSLRALYLAKHRELLWQTEVKDSAFERSYRYYGIHGKDLDDIYGAVLDSLGQREYKMGIK